MISSESSYESVKQESPTIAVGLGGERQDLLDQIRERAAGASASPPMIALSVPTPSPPVACARTPERYQTSPQSPAPPTGKIQA
jgi:hypothetical protein